MPNQVTFTIRGANNLKEIGSTAIVHDQIENIKPVVIPVRGNRLKGFRRIVKRATAIHNNGGIPIVDIISTYRDFSEP